MRKRTRRLCFFSLFCFSAQWSKWRSVKSWRGRGIWEEEEEDEIGRGRGQSARCGAERDKETIHRTHAWTHTHRHTIVTEHNSEVTTVFFFSTAVPVGGMCECMCVCVCVYIWRGVWGLKHSCKACSASVICMELVCQGWKVTKIIQESGVSAVCICVCACVYV